jgi:threonine aldolase
MNQPFIDLRSDTVTRPTPGMRKAIAEAPVGDDVIDTDPTVERLQALTAERLGKEAAIYMPSGTMTNQTAVRLHCSPGSELLCDANCHIYNYEQGGFAQLSGAVARPVQGEFGVMRLEQLQGMIRPDNEHFPRTRLVCIENTHNRGAGRIQPYDEVERICRWAHEHDLRTHLDGARLFNAAVASGIPADRWAQRFDTVSVCFSKGLGAPVGSALAGTRDLIREARRHRKLFGGGMRQAGIIAAGALYALEHHIDRLADDHAHGQLLAQAVRNIEGLILEPETVDTNIVIFRVDPQLASAPEMAAALHERGVLVLAFSATQIRAVTHLDVDETSVRRAVDILRQTTDALRRGVRPMTQGAAY